MSTRLPQGPDPRQRLRDAIARAASSSGAEADAVRALEEQWGPGSYLELVAEYERTQHRAPDHRSTPEEQSAGRPAVSSRTRRRAGRAAVRELHTRHYRGYQRSLQAAGQHDAAPRPLLRSQHVMGRFARDARTARLSAAALPRGLARVFVAEIQARGLPWGHELVRKWLNGVWVLLLASRSTRLEGAARVTSGIGLGAVAAILRCPRTGERYSREAVANVRDGVRAFWESTGAYWSVQPPGWTVGPEDRGPSGWAYLQYWWRGEAVGGAWGYQAIRPGAFATHLDEETRRTLVPELVEAEERARAGAAAALEDEGPREAPPARGGAPVTFEAALGGLGDGPPPAVAGRPPPDTP